MIFIPFDATPKVVAVTVDPSTPALIQEAFTPAFGVGVAVVADCVRSAPTGTLARVSVAINVHAAAHVTLVPI